MWASTVIFKEYGGSGPVGWKFSDRIQNPELCVWDLFPVVLLGLSPAEHWVVISFLLARCQHTVHWLRCNTYCTRHPALLLWLCWGHGFFSPLKGSLCLAVILLFCYLKITGRTKTSLSLSKRERLYESSVQLKFKSVIRCSALFFISGRRLQIFPC